MGLGTPNHPDDVKESLGTFGYVGPEDLELSSLEWVFREAKGRQ